MIKTNKIFMKMAYQEAIHSIGLSDPNPAVGAILVKNGSVLSGGSTMPVGSKHAEIVAIEKAHKKYGSDITRGASLYVTLEPCSHHGRTPPCVNKIIEAGISHVYVDHIDLSPKVNGSGIKILEENHVGVTFDNNSTFKTEKLLTLMPFFKQQQTGLPLCILKWAETKEGWLAPREDSSGRISFDDAIEIVHRLRHLFRATLVTPNTVASDLPRLNVRANLNKINTWQQTISSTWGEAIRRYENIKDKQNFTKNRKLKNYRYFILPTHWKKKDINKFYSQQIKINHQFYFITYSQLQANRMAQEKIGYRLLDRSTLLLDSLRVIAEDGHNQVMIESGHKVAQYLIDSKIPDILICVKSKQNAVFQNGVGLLFDNSSSLENNLLKYGYKQIDQIDLAQDTILFFQIELLLSGA